jgi:hypothetical protein
MMMTYKEYIQSLPSEYLQMLWDEDVHLFQAYKEYVTAWKSLEAEYGEIKNVIC